MAEIIFINLLEAFREIFRATISDLSIWWLLAPILLLWISLEIYLGEYSREGLGWNTTFANGLSLAWVTIESFRYLFSDTLLTTFWLRFLILIIILTYAIFVILTSFYHRFRIKTMSYLAGPSPVYFLALITILWGHGLLDISAWVLLALFILFWLIAGIFALLRKLLAADIIGFIVTKPKEDEIYKRDIKDNEYNKDDEDNKDKEDD